MPAPDGGQRKSGQPKSKGRARYEAQMAQIYRRELPLGHPYRFLPSWMPYSIAKPFSAIVRAVTRQRSKRGDQTSG